jgi:osmotically-inducible protein OsmY
MGRYRGRGPRGYVRSPARIYEDLCDRLTDNPFVDASDIEVVIAGTEVTLNGTVKDPIALRQAQAIAEEVAGVTHVHNRLQLRPAGEREATPGEAVNAALGTGKR